MDVPLKYTRTLQSLAEVKLPSYLKIVGNFKRFYFQQTLCCSLRLAGVVVVVAVAVGIRSIMSKTTTPTGTTALCGY